MAMATASQSLPGLEVTAPDDDMEITSDLGHADDDIDIDIDISGDYQRDQDEDFMLEDARSEAGLDSHQATYADNNDDIMLDGENDNVEDGVMRDDITVPDEHLTDVSEMVQEDATSSNVVNNDVDTVNFVDYEFDEEAPKQSDHDNDFNPEEAHAVYEQTTDNMAPITADQHGSTKNIQSVSLKPPPSPAQDKQEPYPPSKPSPEINGSDEPREMTHEEKLAEVNLQKEDEVRQSSGRSSPVPEEKNSEQTHEQDYSQEQLEQEQLEQNQEVHERSISTSNPLSQQGDTFQAQPSSLHPVIVTYLDNEISLFPPREQDQSETFFLQDESIAYQTIGELLQACRTVLGETIRDEDELEMDIADLGLCISEDCVHASAICFSQILDVYTLLHQQDGTPSPDPLYVTLNTKTRFSSRFDQLNAAALEGKGISQLTFLGDPEEDGSEYLAQGIVGSEQEGQPPGVTPKSQNSERTDSGTQYGKHEPQIPAQGQADHPAPKPQESAEKGGAVSHHGENPDSTQDAEENPEDDQKNDQATGNIVDLPGQSVKENIHKESPEESGEEDLIDYDDGDDEDHVQHTEGSGSGPSSGSSTIQGDANGSPQYSDDPDAESQSNNAEKGPGDPEGSESFVLVEDNPDAALPGYGYHGFAEEIQPLEIDGHEHEQNNEYGETQPKVLQLEPKSSQQDELPLEQQHDQGGSVEDHDHEQYSNQEQPYEEKGHNISGQDQDFPDEGTYDYQDGFPPDTHQDEESEDFEDPEHGDFDYPEFNDDHAEPNVEESPHPEYAVEQPDDGLYDHDSDAIDYEDDEDESPPKTLETPSQTSRYRPSASPPAKRSWAEHEGSSEDQKSGLDTKRVRSR